MSHNIIVTRVDVRFKGQPVAAFFVPSAGIRNINDASTFQGTVIHCIITWLAPDGINDECRGAGRGREDVRELGWSTGSQREGRPEAIVTDPKTLRI